jgi:type IV secretory pathway protease TraF
MNRERLKNIALATTITLLVLVLFALSFHWAGITGAVFSDSEPPGIYRATGGPIWRGEMVQLRQLMKHVAAVPGDTVRVTPEGSYINGKLWPYSGIPTETHYRPFPYGTYKLAPGQFWLLGQNPLSWDSRFVGMIPQDMIATPVQPLWTISNGYAPGTRLW